MSLEVAVQKNDQLGISQICYLPSAPALGKCLPVELMKRWVRNRAKFLGPHHGRGPLFITLCGHKKGGRVSTDSFRKHVSASFGQGKASHSLRKGGAKFFARHHAAEDATRQQGGWRTSEVMKTIYTKLSTLEVEHELSTVANRASLSYDLRTRINEACSVESGSVAKIRALLTFVESVEQFITEEVLSHSRIGHFLKANFSHTDANVRALAIALRTRIRLKWKEERAAKRQRQEP